MELAGRSQSIYRVEVSTEFIPPGGAQVEWANRISRLKGLKPPPGASDVIIRTFELAPGVQAVWYFTDVAFAELRELEARKFVGDQIVLARRGVEAGGETDIERLVRNVINAYVPGDEHGFCIGAGAITSEPGINEQALARFVHRKLPEFEMSFDTHTVREPATQHPLSDIAADQRAFEAAGGSLTILRDTERTVAEIPGREGRISVVSPGENPFVRFTWHFAGVAQRSDLPEILIDGFAPTEHEATFEAVWEAMLQSVRRVPLSPKRSL
jgi:hypothetical protein